jgi:glycosyltransferase involved in cell wall biosynthesis
VVAKEKEDGMNLVVISDTPMVPAGDGGHTAVFEPTLREIEFVCDLFDRVVWYGYDASLRQLGSSRRPKMDSIELRLFPTVRGGSSFWLKLRVLFVLPILTWMVVRAMLRADIVHTRGPSVPAAICVVLSWLFRRKIFWHKYAGNWMEPSPPFMYGFQRWMLKQTRHCHVTVNGMWPGQPQHIHAFENPCFTAAEMEHANRTAAAKRFDGILTLCFVGHLVEAKGILELFEAIRMLRSMNVPPFRLIVSGDGPLLDVLRRQAQGIGVEVLFTGYLKREELNAIYESSHVLVLPSRSEGFPKVVAECAAFGCIPVVTDVSAIGQYVLHGRNGFLLESNSPESIAKVLRGLLLRPDLKAISIEAMKMSQDFTYERFMEKVAIMLGIPLKNLHK